MRYEAEPGTEVNGVDQAGNAWPEPLVFDAKGVLEVPDDQQDVISALETAVANGAIRRARAASTPAAKGKE